MQLVNNMLSFSTNTMVIKCFLNHSLLAISILLPARNPNIKSIIAESDEFLETYAALRPLNA